MCRSRRELSNKYLLAKFGFDTAENEPPPPPRTSLVNFARSPRTDPPGVYHLYEVYTDDEAAAYHKTTEHYKKWADFKAANPSVGETQTVVKGTHVRNIIQLNLEKTIEGREKNNLRPGDNEVYPLFNSAR